MFCFFCGSAIPTSPYMLNVFYTSLAIIILCKALDTQLASANIKCTQTRRDKTHKMHDCTLRHKMTRLYIQVAELASLAQLLPLCSPTVRNPAPDSSLKSCFSPIASASAAARRLRPLQLLLPGPIAASASTAAPRLPPPRVQLLPPRLRPASAAARCFHDQLLLAAFMISCCSRSIASASTAAPRLCPLQLLFARLRPL